MVMCFGSGMIFFGVLVRWILVRLSGFCSV